MHVRQASIAILLAACAAAFPLQADEGGEHVLVHYPVGACETGHIEIQVFDRETAVWVAHPEHPRIEAGTCQREVAYVLLNELRIRCVDPSGRRTPSDWVSGVTLRPAESGSPCAP